MTKEQHPICKPLLHHIQAITSYLPEPLNEDAPCQLHGHERSSWQDEKICPVHGELQMFSEQQSLVAPGSCNEIMQKISVGCSASIASPTSNDNETQFDKQQYDKSGFLNINFSGEGDVDERGERDEGGGSWSVQPEDDLKKTCEKLCKQIQWKSEKHCQEVACSNFREIVHCQATLHAFHEESVESSRGFTGSKQNLCENCYHVPLRNFHRSMLSLSSSHIPFSDATFTRQFGECKKERPMSAPIHNQMQRITILGQSHKPEDLIQRYSFRNRLWIAQFESGNGVCVGSKGVKPKEDHLVPLHPSPLLRNNRFRSKSVELKKPRFCTAINRGKGETMSEDSPKKMLKVLPVIVLHLDNTKSVWNRKANQKEWDYGHQGCCSEHWVSVLDKNKKVQGEGCRPQVARSLDLSSSPLSSLKAIVDDMSKPQRANLPKQISDAVLSVGTPRSSSTCRSSGKPSIADPLARNLNTPEFNSSARLLARMEALQKEMFTEPKALQIAKEHGIVLDKEDEAALKKFVQWEQSPSPEHERNKTHEKYFSLSNISAPAESFVVAMRKSQKQLDPKACVVRIQDQPSTSDQCTQVCLKLGDLNLKNLNDGPDWSDEENGWIERCMEAHTTMNEYNSCHT